MVARHETPMKSLEELENNITTAIRKTTFLTLSL